MKNSFGFSIQYKELDAQLAESKFAASGTARAQRGMRAFRVCLYGGTEELDAQLAESEGGGESYAGNQSGKFIKNLSGEV